MHGRELRIHRKKRKAERELETMLNHYPTCKVKIQLAIDSYVDKYQFNPYMESYITRLQQKRNERPKREIRA